ncbi:hypothetical protein AJ79_07209 [Helicocarpus griseus UAMH5409]|uniref:CENP-V/GFA domain-containing protein n=1 Tax=Helicocarpus griseus UAMH5409 TaxID=1447875 RepID=A0A2B7X5F7_9EURO|nr:hypothetical protein AJ79_07209 [Helicocarpus griseus UAMH5409]
MASENPSASEQWQHEPPYKIQGGDEFGAVYWTGSCQCGRVSYKLNREKPLDAKYCHCTGCQVLHGAPFQWAAIFHKSDMTFTHGHQGMDFYKSSEKKRVHDLPCKATCSYCHSPIMDEGRNVILLFPGLIKGNEKGNADVRRVFKPR